MKQFRFIVTLLAISLFSVGCSSTNTTDEVSEEEVDTNTEVVNEEEKDPVRVKVKRKDEEKEKEEAPYVPSDEELALFEIKGIEDLKIEQQEIDNLYDENNNFPAHTEKEIVMDFADDNGMIEFALDDQPVRNITSEDGKINNITNYSDHFIDMTNEVAFVYPEEKIETLYNIVVHQSPDAIGGYDGDGDIDFRSFDELTNLERAMLTSIGLTGPLLNALDEMMMTDSFDEETYEVIAEQFELLGSPTVLIPAPQTFYDYELFNIMLIIKDTWMELGNYSDPNEDFDAFVDSYTELRQITNNLFAYLYVTIGDLD